MRNTPTLTTARLTLRAPQMTDVDALAAIYADPVVMRSIRGGPRSREQTLQTLSALRAHWQDEGYGMWAVTESATDQLLGVCGFVERGELGYILAQAAWGRGIATEAARACLAYGFERLNWAQIGAGALTTNAASLHVIEKLGMRPTPNAFFDAHGGVYYTLDRARYASAQHATPRSPEGALPPAASD